MNAVHRGWLARVGPWVGLSTSPVALVAGGGVAEGLRGASLLAALVVGSLLLATLACVQGVLGQRRGRPLAALTTATLGTRGSRWVGSAVMLAMMLGWMGVNTGIAGVALGRLVHLPDAAGVLLMAALMLVVAAFGLGALSWTGLVAGVAATALAVYGMSLVLADREVTLHGGFAGAEPMSVAAGVTLMVGYGAAFSLRTPDFTHDLAHSRQVVACALWGLGLPLVGFAVAGALLYTATGSWDLADALHALGSSDLAYLFVAVGFTGSILTNVWSGGLALRDMAPALRPVTAMALLSAFGAVAALAGIADRALDWLTLMALSSPGLIVLCVLERRAGEGDAPPWRIHTLVAWAMGMVCATGLASIGSSFALPAAVIVPACLHRLATRRPRMR